MRREEFLDMIGELLELPPGRLEGLEVLADLGWDSLAVVGFLGVVDERLGVVLSPEQIRNCVTPNDLAGLLGDGIS
jgi:acyl carrier protein